MKTKLNFLAATAVLSTVIASSSLAEDTLSPAAEENQPPVAAYDYTDKDAKDVKLIRTAEDRTWQFPRQ